MEETKDITFEKLRTNKKEKDIFINNFK